MTEIASFISMSYGLGVIETVINPKMSFVFTDIKGKTSIFILLLHNSILSAVRMMPLKHYILYVAYDNARHAVHNVMPTTIYALPSNGFLIVKLSKTRNIFDQPVYITCVASTSNLVETFIHNQWW